MGIWDKLKNELIDIIEWIDDAQAGRDTMCGGSRGRTTRLSTARS